MTPERDSSFFKKVVEAGGNLLRPPEDYIALKALHWYWEIGKLKSPEAEQYFEEMCKSVLSGEKVSFAEYADKLLSGYPLGISGQSNIPTEKDIPVIKASNYWEEGPMRGYWGNFLASREIKKVRGEDVRDIIADSWELVSGIEFPFTARYIRSAAAAFGLLIVTAPFKAGKNDVVKQARPIFRVLRDNGVVGLNPEANPSKKLVYGWPGSGRLIQAVATHHSKTKILPVGVVSDGDKLCLNFGPAFEVSQVCSKDDANNPELQQRIANRLMEKISPLVPKKYQRTFSPGQV